MTELRGWLGEGLSPRRVALVFLVACGVVLPFAWVLGDRPPSWYPVCLFHEWTGLYCPGCGSARAVHAMLHGEWLRAARENLLLIGVLPLLTIWAAHALWMGIRYDARPKAAPTGWARLTFAVVVGFLIVRNLPWWPFRLLAPI